MSPPAPFPPSTEAQKCGGVGHQQGLLWPLKDTPHQTVHIALRMKLWSHTARGPKPDYVAYQTPGVRDYLMPLSFSLNLQMQRDIKPSLIPYCHEFYKPSKITPIIIIWLFLPSYASLKTEITQHHSTKKSIE